MKKSIFYFMTAFLLSTGLYASEKVFFEEKFSKDGTMNDNGFVQLRTNNKDIFEVKNGVLNITCFNSPMKGTYWKKNAKIIPQGEFSFELRTCIGGKQNRDNLSLKFHYGQHIFAFRYPNWEVYDAAKRKWSAAGRITDSKWHTLKVRFNAAKKLAEYFIDDMQNPVFINEEFIYNPKLLPYFGIENYGLSKETVQYELKNLKVVELSGKETAAGPVKLNGTSLFKGISSTEWPLNALVKKLGEKKLQIYNLDTPGQHVDNGANIFKLVPNPPLNPSELPRNFILADIPFNTLPPYVHKQILASVKNGGRLIILRGYFSLNKGNCTGTELAKILPVSVNDKWSEPSVLKNAEIISRNGKTVMAISKYGKGRVIAALEMPHLQKVGDCLLEYDYNNEG